MYYRTNENKTDLCFRQNNPPTTTVAKMNPKKAKGMFFHIELSEVVILNLVVGVVKKKIMEASENMYLVSEYLTQEETNKAIFYHRFCIIMLGFIYFILRGQIKSKV